jgi:hypothetical protein
VRVFLFQDIFPEMHIWNKSRGLEGCSRPVSPLTRSHTENLQTPVLCLKEYSQCLQKKRKKTFARKCEISSSHGGEYDVQSCLLGCTAV